MITDNKSAPSTPISISPPDYESVAFTHVDDRMYTGIPISSATNLLLDVDNESHHERKIKGDFSPRSSTYRELYTVANMPPTFEKSENEPPAYLDEPELFSLQPSYSEDDITRTRFGRAGILGALVSIPLGLGLKWMDRKVGCQQRHTVVREAWDEKGSCGKGKQREHRERRARHKAEQLVRNDVEEYGKRNTHKGCCGKRRRERRSAREYAY